jgi:hypothetical protein
MLLQQFTLGRHDGVLTSCIPIAVVQDQDSRRDHRRRIDREAAPVIRARRDVGIPASGCMA